MNKDSFYQTSLTYNCTTNIVACTDDVNTTYNGNIDNYYIGYMNPDDVPSFYKPVRVQWGTQSSKISLSRIDNIDYASFAYVQKTANPTNKNLLYNYANNTYNITTHYRGINSMSPLNAPVFNLSSGHIWRIDMRVYYLFSDESEHIRVTNAYFTFATATDLIDFLKNGTHKTTDFTITHFVSPSVSVNISLSLTAGQFSDGHYMHTDIYDNTSCTLHFVVTGLTCNYTNNWYRNNGINSAVSGCYVSPLANIKTSETNVLCYYSNAHYVRVAYNSQNHVILNFSPQSQGSDDYIKIGDLYYGIGIYNNGDIDLRNYENPLEFYALNGCYLAWVNPTVNGAFELTAIVTWNDIIFTLAQFPCLSSRTAGDIYLPEFDGNRLTGNWFLVEDLDEKGTEWQKSDDISDSTYTDDDKPATGGIDDTDKGTGENLPDLGLKFAASGGFTSFYLLSLQDIAALESALSVVEATFWQALGTATDYKQSNLLNYIVSLKWYPLDILAGNQGLFADTATSEIKFAYNQDSKLSLTSGNTYKLASAIRYYNMGTVSVPYKLAQETFLDHDPYTTCQIWLPFCGLYPVRAEYVVGDTIHFYYIVDLNTGMCTAIVANSRFVILTATGKIGVDYTVSGNDIITQSERMASSYINAGLSAFSGGVQTGTAAVSGDVMGTVSAGVNAAGSIAQNAINIASAQRSVPVVVGSGSGFGSTFSPSTPAIIVSVPAVKIPADYGHTSGYVYNQVRRIGDLSGFVVCDNPDLSGITATEAELNEIHSVLTSGFYA